jgi:hypothetical protein
MCFFSLNSRWLRMFDKSSNRLESHEKPLILDEFFDHPLMVMVILMVMGVSKMITGFASHRAYATRQRICSEHAACTGKMLCANRGKEFVPWKMLQPAARFCLLVLYLGTRIDFLLACDSASGIFSKRYCQVRCGRSAGFCLHAGRSCNHPGKKSRSRTTWICM